MRKYLLELCVIYGFSTLYYKKVVFFYLDAICLTSFKGAPGHRGYAIYKIFSIDNNAYVMVLKSSLFLAPPVLLTEAQTLSMINNPKEAIIFANKIWKCRYQQN